MGSTYHHLFYHYVWGTFKRLEMIDNEMEKDLRKIVNDKIVEKKSEMISFGCTSDHVHILVKQHPAVSVSEMIGEVKGYSSYVINKFKSPDFGFRWQRGFCAITISKKDLPWLKRYIKNQKDHHANIDLDPNLEIKQR